MRRSIVWRTAAVVVAAALVIWSMSCAKNPVTGKRELMLISTADEIALGKQLDPEILQTYGKYSNPELDAYVAALGHKLGALSHRPDLTYTVQVVDSDVVNAFAVPGGYVYLTRGMLSYLNDEAELAGVMSHEIGHIAARHSVHQYSQAQLAMLGLGVGSMFSETFQKYAGIAQLGLSMLFLKFSRDDERQADALGVEYASRAGFDANHMANMFVTLERLNPGSDRSGLPGWFSTHPNPPDRIAAIQRDAQVWRDKLAGTAFVTNRDGYLGRLEGLVFGEDPRQGYVEGQAFYHPQLAFQFPVPSGWKVNNTAAQVQLYARERDTATVKTVSADASAVVLALTDTLDDALFDQPLTVKVRLDPAWTTCQAVQQDKALPCTVIEHEGARFALVEGVIVRRREEADAFAAVRQALENLPAVVQIGRPRQDFGRVFDRRGVGDGG
ncbi:MAG TPA: M48 family metalloprotease, partial [Acidobacteriota bacterium]|nr:M48 family metalloprotease [Acidobacteriota bacterium]